MFDLKEMVAQAKNSPTQIIMEREGLQYIETSPGHTVQSPAYWDAFNRDSQVKSLNALLISMYLGNAVDNAHDMGADEALESYGYDEHGLANISDQFDRNNTVARRIWMLAQIGAGCLLAQGVVPDLSLLDGDDQTMFIEHFREEYDEALKIKSVTGSAVENAAVSVAESERGLK